MLLYYLKRELNKSYACIEADLKNWGPNSTIYIETFLEEKKVLPDVLGPFKLISKKVEDLLDCVSLGTSKVISDRVICKFSNLNMPKHHLVDVIFSHKNVTYNSHKALYFPEDKDVLNLIDWDKSSFYKTKDWHETILEEYKFTNWDEMRSFERQFWGDREFGFLRKLKIRYNQPYDLISFRYPGFPTGFICTEKVKKIIEEEGFTGFRFEPVEEEYFV